MLTELFNGEKIVSVLLIFGVAFLASRFLKGAVERIVRRTVRPNQFKTKRDEIQREDTLISILNTALKVVIAVVTIIAVLGVYGVALGPLLAGAGLISVALGFGAQSLVKDLLAGLFILSENQYRVGDVLQVNQDVAGVVEHVSLRMTILRDLDGKVHYIPNGTIEIATNLTMEYANVDLNIGVSYDTDIDKLEKVIADVGEALYQDEKWHGVALEAAHMLRVEDFADSAIIVKVICKTAPIRQWEVKGELLRRLKKAFAKAGIEIPYPQHVVHMQHADTTK